LELRVLRGEVPGVFFCLLLPFVPVVFFADPVFEDVERVDLEAMVIRARIWFLSAGIIAQGFYVMISSLCARNRVFGFV